MTTVSTDEYFIALCFEYDPDPRTFISSLAEDMITKLQHEGYPGETPTIKKDKHRYIQWLKNKEVLGSATGKELTALKKKLEQDEFKRRVIKSITDTLKVCKTHARSEKTVIYLIPSFNESVINDMKGTTGFTVGPNEIFIYFNPIEGWENEIPDCVAHEFYHAVHYQVQRAHLWKKPLGEVLVSEGLPEHFRETVLDGERKPYTKTLTYEQAKKIWTKILGSARKRRGQKFKRAVLYGKEGEFNKWTGYSVGYYIVQDFLRNYYDDRAIDWNETLKLDLSRILRIGTQDW